MTTAAFPDSLPKPDTPLSQGDLSALEHFLDHLEKFSTGLGAAALEHILTGKDPGTLERIAAAVQKASPFLAVHYAHNSALQRVLLASEGWDIAVARRLGEMLAAALKVWGHRWRFPGQAANLDFLCALACMTEDCLTRIAPCAPAPSRWLLTGPRCLSLLALEGADQAALMQLLFAPFTTSYGQSTPFQHLLQLSMLPEVLGTTPERTLEGARALTALPRSRSFGLLERSGLARQPVFRELLFDTIARGGLEARRNAFFHLRRGNTAELTQEAGEQLRSGFHARTREAAAWVLYNIDTPQSRGLLEAQLLQEKSVAVRQQIAMALHRPTTQAFRIERKPGVPPASADEHGYVAIGGGWVSVPPAVLPACEPPPAGLVEEWRALIADFRQALEQVEERRGSAKSPVSGLFPAGVAEELAGILDGTVEPRQASAAAGRLAGFTGWDDGQWPAGARYCARLEALLSRPGVTPWHLARLFAVHLAQKQARLCDLVAGAGGPVPVQLLRRSARSAGDLRPVLAACAPFGAGGEALLGELLQQPHLPWTPDAVPPLWQTVAAHRDFLYRSRSPLRDSNPATQPASLRALELAALLPAPPETLRERLMEQAIRVWDDRTGTLARALLGSTPQGAGILRAWLNHRSTLEREAAIQWMSECGDRSAIPLLRARLAREKRDDLRTGLRQALKALDEDLAGDRPEEGHPERELCPHAVKLREDMPGSWLETRRKVEGCMDLGQLPGLAWTDGRAVPPETVRDWVVSAAWHRSDTGDPALACLLQQLSLDSREALALHVLSALLAYDTLRPSEAEAKDYASWRIPLDSVSRRSTDDRAARRAHARYMAQHRQRCLQNGYDLRGLLQLVWPGLTDGCLTFARAYFRKHGSRTGMAHALLRALARRAGGHPAHPGALVLLHEVAMTHRNETVCSQAGNLLDDLAEASGCTRGELADRAIPLLGLDDRGMRALHAGSRYTAVLADSLQIGLRNEAGALVRCLEPEDASEAHQGLAELRKELEIVVAQQTARLQAAMRAGRIWKPDPLREGLLQHPIAGRMCRRLIFAAVDADGHLCGTFRVLKDGRCVNAALEAIDLQGIAGVRLAHSALLTEEAIHAWRQHLQDHKVAPLFEQLY